MEKIIEKLKGNKKQIKLYFLIFALAFLICGPFLRFHLSVDSYAMVKFPIDHITSSLSGRPISDLVLGYTNVIGFDMMNHQQFYNIISIIIMAIASIILYKTCEELTCNRTKSIWVTGIASLLIIFNVFGFEMFLFNVMLSLSIQYLLIIYSVRIILKEFTLKNFIISILLNLLGLCIYQSISPIFLGISMVLFGYKYKDLSLWKNIKNYIYIGFIYGFACLGNLFIINLSPANRFSGSLIQQNLILLLQKQKLLWIDAYNFFPKMFFISIIIILFVLSIILILKYNRKSFVKLALSLTGAIGMVIIATFLPHIYSSTIIIPRTALAISSIPGIIILFIGINFTNMHNYYKIFISIIVIIYMLIIANTSCILVDRLVSTNIYDNNIAKEILYIIDKYENQNNIKVTKMSFTSDESVLFQYQNNNPISGVDVYVKAFSISWARTNIFEFYFNRIYKQVEMDNSVYQKYFAGKNWNEFSKDQVVIIDDTAYIAVF